MESVKGRVDRTHDHLVLHFDNPLLLEHVCLLIGVPIAEVEFSTHLYKGRRINSEVFFVYLPINEVPGRVHFLGNEYGHWTKEVSNFDWTTCIDKAISSGLKIENPDMLSKIKVEQLLNL